MRILSESIRHYKQRRMSITLQWRHNGPDSVWNHQPHHCLLKRLFRRRSKKTSKLRVTGLFAGNSPETGEFPAQMASNAEKVSIWWRHHDIGGIVLSFLPEVIVVGSHRAYHSMATVLKLVYQATHYMAGLKPHEIYTLYTIGHLRTAQSSRRNLRVMMRPWYLTLTARWLQMTWCPNTVSTHLIYHYRKLAKAASDLGHR